ncbi:MAG: hypothetical protein HKO93_04040, partial [Flavobacteriales bacterium]|nr:hypothetical protein [Flavobacteriales bacterium]
MKKLSLKFLMLGASMFVLTNMYAQPSCEDNEVTVLLTTDNFGSETTWQLLDSEGGEIFFGGPYDSNIDTSEVFCLPDGCYEFTIFDAFGDGICCGFGEGSY